MNKKINNLTWRDFKIDVYLDTANLKIIKNLVDDPAIKGITTNPMLLRETMSKGMAYEKYPHSQWGMLHKIAYEEIYYER